MVLVAFNKQILYKDVGWCEEDTYIYFLGSKGRGHIGDLCFGSDNDLSSFQHTTYFDERYLYILVSKGQGHKLNSVNTLVLRQKKMNSFQHKTFIFYTRW